MPQPSDELVTGMRLYLDELVVEVRQDGDPDVGELADILTHLGDGAATEDKVQFLSLALALAIIDLAKPPIELPPI